MEWYPLVVCNRAKIWIKLLKSIEGKWVSVLIGENLEKVANRDKLLNSLERKLFSVRKRRETRLAGVRKGSSVWPSRFLGLGENQRE